jgi:DNA (cytosine-5)-methyltransferase 1
LSLGVEEAARSLGFGIEHLLAVDVDVDALQVFGMNRGGSPVLHGSVRQLVESRVRGEGENARFSFCPEIASSELEKLVGNVDIVVAGPPCQGHSTLNNYSRGDDPRNGLYLTVPAVAIALNAPLVLIENVPNVVHDRLGVVAATRQLLADAGYAVADGVLASDKMGWGQTRKRFFLMASKLGKPISPAEIVLLSSRTPMSLGDLIGDLVDSYVEDDIFNSTPTLSPANQERIRHLFDSDSHNLPNDLRPECHKSGTTYKAVYGRMFWDRPAPTITSGFLTPGRGRFVHPLRRRVLTPHEAARVQGFPDWFKFIAPGSDVTRTLLTKWIGDAVPPILGYYAALGLLGDFK